MESSAPYQIIVSLLQKEARAENHGISGRPFEPGTEDRKPLMIMGASTSAYGFDSFGQVLGSRKFPVIWACVRAVPPYPSVVIGDSFYQNIHRA